VALTVSRRRLLIFGSGSPPAPSHQTLLPAQHTREGMHYYSYDGCDSDSLESDSLSRSNSETSGTQSQRSLIILLDDDDDDEFEPPVHPLPSHRPKRPLPRNFSRSYRAPVKEEMAQATETPSPEADHTINCAPGLREKRELGGSSFPRHPNQPP
jgi:hypothetical protein